MMSLDPESLLLSVNMYPLIGSVLPVDGEENEMKEKEVISSPSK